MLDGKEPVYRALHYFLQRGELGHALLLSGPAGSGKKNLALQVAQALNCQQQGELPCGECPNCRKIARGSYPDLFHLACTGSSIKIGQVKELKERLYYRPQEGRFKICLVEDADRLTPEASNSLLKVLEDPPRDLLFILLTARPAALPATVLSRCHHFSLRFSLQRSLPSRVSAPSLPISLINFLKGSDPERVREISSEKWSSRREEVFELVRCLREGRVQSALEQAEAMASRSDLPDFLDLMLSVYRDRLVWRYTGEPELIVNADCLEFFRGGPVCPLWRLEEGMEQISGLRNKLLLNINVRVNLEVVFLRLKEVF